MDTTVFERPATPRVIDFANAMKVVHWRDAQGKMHEKIEDDRPVTLARDGQQFVVAGGARSGTVLNAKQIRARQRRQLKRGDRLTDAQFNLGMKPLEEWDEEELARGRPRNINGNFSGRPPMYITRELHERAMELFKSGIRSNMNAHTISAIGVINTILTSEEVDDKGKPIVPAGTKLDAAKFLLEHVVGKPVQPTVTDVSVKLQGILGAVMVNPTDLGSLPGYAPAHVGTRGQALELTEGSDGVFSDDEDYFEEDNNGE